MSPPRELIDEIYRQKIRHSRSLTPAQRVLGSFELTESALLFMAAGVRHQFPAAGEEEVQRIICQRIERLRRLHNRR